MAVTGVLGALIVIAIDAFLSVSFINIGNLISLGTFDLNEKNRW